MVEAYDSGRGDNAMSAKLGHADEDILMAADAVVALDLKGAVPSVEGAVAEHGQAALNGHMSSG